MELGADPAVAGPRQSRNGFVLLGHRLEYLLLGVGGHAAVEQLLLQVDLLELAELMPGHLPLVSVLLLPSRLTYHQQLLYRHARLVLAGRRPFLCEPILSYVRHAIFLSIYVSKR